MYAGNLSGSTISKSNSGDKRDFPKTDCSTGLFAALSNSIQPSVVSLKKLFTDVTKECKSVVAIT
jgi:hypothetical protein